MSTPVIVIGAGGHAGVVADALLAAGRIVLGYTDADPSLRGTRRCELLVLGSDDEVLSTQCRDEIELANGVAGTAGTGARQALQQRLEKLGWRFTAVCHPAAVVSPFARLGAGTQVFAAAVVQPGADLAAGCIVNTGATVEHDCRLAAHVHVAPGAVLCGNVQVGERSHVGAGAVVRQNVRLGADTIVGAGAVVIDDFAAGGTLIGMPARPIESGA